MKNVKAAMLVTILLAFALFMLPVKVWAATTTTVLDGQVSLVDTEDKNTVSSDVVTIKAEGGLIGRETNTVAITIDPADNTKDYQFSLSYVASNYNAFTINGTAQTSATGTYSVEIAAGGTASLTMAVQGIRSYGAGQAVLKLSDFVLKEKVTNPDVTFSFESSLGGVTVDDAAIQNNDIITCSAGTFSLVAAPSTGTTFLGWVDAADGSLLSTASSYTLTPVANMSVRAVFVNANSSACFYVGAGTAQKQEYGLIIMGMGGEEFPYYTVTSYSHLFEDLNKATAAAQSSGTSKYVVLANSGTLPAGNYAIPSGVTLVIPFDSSNTNYTENAQWTGGASTYKQPTAYRTLTMASGANITIDSGGAMSVSGKYTYAAGGSALAVSGPVGMVKMNSGSTITVNGSLYTYGFIHGSGTVTVNTTGKVYELLQLGDCRGGTQTTGMEHGVLPFSQYWVQNIEVPTTYHGGAKLRANLVIYMSSMVFVTGVDMVTDVNSVGLFKPQAGSTITKKYVGSEDRTYIEINGDTTIDTFTISVNGITIDTAEYVFPQTNSWEFSFNSGTTTVKQDLAVIPGAVDNISTGATVVLAEGTRVYYYDTDKWGTYCYNPEASTDVTMLSVKYSPTKTYTRTAADLVDSVCVCAGIFDATEGGLYTTAGGAAIVGEEGGVVKIATGTETVTYQYRQTADTYDEIAINPAWLKNSDGSFVKSGTDTYTYIDGFWRCGTHSWGSDYLCSVCGQAMIRYDAINLSIVGEVKLNLKFEIEASLIEDGLTVYVTEEQNEVDKDGDSWNKAVTAEMLDSDKVRYVISQGIAAGEMPGDVKVQFKIGDTVVPIYDKDSKIVTSEPLVKNVRNYASQGLASDKQTLKDLCHWMVVYGGYAQQYFKTHTDDYMYDLVPKDDRDVSGAVLNQEATVSDGDIGITVGKQRINLNSEIYMRTYFELEEGHTIGEYTFTLTSPTEGGKAEIQGRIEYGQESGNLYYVDIKNIPVAYWNDMYTITVTHSSGGTYSVTSSVLAWAARCVAQSDNAAQKNMARAMVYYADAADAYFIDE